MTHGVKKELKMNNNGINNLDEQLNTAVNRKNERGETVVTIPGTGNKSKRRRLTKEEKEARAEERARDKENRRLARERAKAEREANAKPAHMAKVEKAAKRLPDLNPETQQAFLDIRESSLSLTDIEALTAHLNHHVRFERTRAALETRVEINQVVRIIGGDVRYIGKVGVVTAAQRIRCYVNIEELDKQVYLFTSDVELLSDSNEGEEASKDEVEPQELSA